MNTTRGHPEQQRRDVDADALATLNDRIAILEAAVLGSREWRDHSGSPGLDGPGSSEHADPLWMLSGLRTRYPDDAVVGFVGRIPSQAAPAANPGPAPDPDDDTRRGSSTGYAGTAPVEWQYGLSVDDVLRPDWDAQEIATALSALGNPTRLRFVQEILRGRDTVAALGELDGVGTTGQVYHHLAQLQSARWVRQVSRGRYGVPVERTVPLLVIALAAGGGS